MQLRYKFDMMASLQRKRDISCFSFFRKQNILKHCRRPINIFIDEKCLCLFRSCSCIYGERHITTRKHAAFWFSFDSESNNIICGVFISDLFFSRFLVENAI